ncbi:probable F-box protein At3g61730 isoform X1 [Primulina eburnea]|uniref:probable F-box protein At3g61730 isoform X1 n=1 Tax=Primulina eburnea TaxID=1245227 RepID=UPI003C6C1330
MGKRLRRARSICCCASPRVSVHVSRQSNVNWFEVDIWTEIAKFMDGRSLVMLGATCKWFNHTMMEDSIWKFACLRDLQVPDPRNVNFKWIKLYTTAFDGSHSYMFCQQEKHIDWMRIGAFSIDSHAVLLTESLTGPIRIPKEETAQKMLQMTGGCILNSIKTGIWIAGNQLQFPIYHIIMPCFILFQDLTTIISNAIMFEDLQLVRCPICDLDACDGTMQVLDARHIELFLNEGYLDGSWDYELVGSHDINKQADAASGGIFDIEHINDQSTSDILNSKLWVGKSTDWQPKSMVTLHAVAVNTNLQQNDGLQIKYHAMKAGKNGEIVSIRISQQLL